MKILIAAGIFPPDPGGPATYAREIAEQFNKQGVRADVVCYSHQGVRDGYSFKVDRIWRTHSRALRYFLYFFKVWRVGRDCDLIYAQGPVSSGLPASKAAKLLNKKFVVKVTGDYAWEQARGYRIYTGSIEDFQKFKFEGKIGKLQKIEREVCQAADLVIVPSQYLKRIVASWGIKDEKIKVIYNAIKKADSNKTKDSNLILSISRLVSWKGLGTLIELMPDLLKINSDFRLTIIGSGPEEKRLNSLVRQLHIEEKVSINHRSYGQTMNELSQAGIYVLNTDYEGLSHTLLEAMRAGVPIVTTRVGGNPELVRDGHNGFLVEYDNKEQLKKAVLDLYRDRDLQAKFIRNSKEVLKKFDFSKMVEDTLNTLRKICES